MPRQANPPRLELFGPDARHGARPRKGFNRYVWYITWNEQRRRRELSTGASDRADAERALAAFLSERNQAAGGSDPAEAAPTAHNTTVSEALSLYGSTHAQRTADPGRIGHAIERLIPFWGSRMISEISPETCRAYAAWRRDAKAGGVGRAGIEAVPAEATIAREISVISAAAGAWFAARGEKNPQLVWKPAPTPAREEWLSRDQAAQLLRKARKDKRIRDHLPLFILFGLYTGRRKQAILNLAWSPNPGGGDVDLERGVIDFEGGGRRSNKRRGKIPIPRQLLRPLRAARRRTRVYVFERQEVRPDGRIAYLPIEDVRGSFATAAKRAGLEDVTPHSLKHTAITWLMRAGLEPWKVAAWTATSLTTILKVYGHHAPDMYGDFVAGQALRPGATSKQTSRHSADAVGVRTVKSGAEA